MGETMVEHNPTWGVGLETIFLALQSYVVVFLLFHDWVPLGRLNNVAAVKSKDSLRRTIFVTLLPAVPAAIGLSYGARYFGRAYPDWLEMLLWITYGLFLLGMLRAWWIPYLFVPDKERAERYRVLFAGTHSFLPRRNGIVPDTLHVSLHLVMVATMVMLLMRTR
jgi:hypothetical protein